MLISTSSYLGLRCKPLMATDWIGTFQLSPLFVSALDVIFFAVLWRLGAGEDLKQIGFWAEPSTSPVSEGALLFAEDFVCVVDGLLKLEAGPVEGVERTVEGLVKIEGTFVKGGDVGAEARRSNLSIDALMRVMCSASDDKDLMALAWDGISGGLPFSLSSDRGFVSVDWAGLFTGAVAAVIDGDCVVMAFSEASSSAGSAGLSVSMFERLKTAVSQASSSAGLLIAVGSEHGWVSEASELCSSLTLSAAYGRG